MLIHLIPVRKMTGKIVFSSNCPMNKRRINYARF
jgi:hypothetical protein